MYKLLFDDFLFNYFFIILLKIKHLKNKEYKIAKKSISFIKRILIKFQVRKVLIPQNQQSKASDLFIRFLAIMQEQQNILQSFLQNVHKCQHLSQKKIKLRKKREHQQYSIFEILFLHIFLKLSN
jgi:hypothetical protein